MKSWGIVGEEFPKPDNVTFFAADDCMNQIKLKLASLEEKYEDTNHDSSEITDSTNLTANNNTENTMKSFETVKHVDPENII